MSTGAVTVSGPGTVAGQPLAMNPGSAGWSEADNLAQWPLSVHLPLGALPTAVPCARMFTRVVLDEWDLAGAADSAGLVVTELAHQLDPGLHRPGRQAEV